MLKVLKESQKPTLTVTGGIPMPGITIATRGSLQEGTDFLGIGV